MSSVSKRPSEPKRPYTNQEAYLHATYRYSYICIGAVVIMHVLLLMSLLETYGVRVMNVRNWGILFTVLGPGYLGIWLPIYLSRRHTFRQHMITDATANDFP